jgi:hypothetical protein
VEIGMTISTGGKFQALFLLFLTVAFGAVYRPVPSFQRIARLTMIEIFGVHQSPTGTAMAGIAIITQLSPMGIVMAWGTLGIRQSGEFRIIKIGRQGKIGHLLMAFRAGDHLMLAGQGILRRRMIKPFDRFPSNLVVAFRTVRIQLTAVFITVTTTAGAFESQVGSAHINLFFFP